MSTTDTVHTMGLLDDIEIDPDFHQMVAASSSSSVNNDSLAWDYQTTGNSILDAACGGVGDKRGIPVGRITVISGKTSTYKTYHVLEAVIQHLIQGPDRVAGVIDSEKAWSQMSLDTLGVPRSISERIHIIKSPVETPALYIEHLYPALIGYMDKTISNGQKPLLIVDSLTNIPVKAEEDNLIVGNNNAFNMERQKVSKRISQVLPAILEEQKVSLIVTVHLAQEIKRINSFQGPSYKETVSESFMYGASLLIRLEKQFSEDGKPEEAGYPEGVRVTERIQIRASVKKTRMNPENSVTYNIIPGFGFDNIRNSLSFLESGLSKVGGVAEYKQKMGEVLRELGIFTDTFNTKAEYGSALRKYSTLSAANSQRVETLLRPLIFQVWDDILSQKKPYAYTKYEYLAGSESDI